MCTAVVSVKPGLPTLLAGIRDELADRAWEPPGRHWPRHAGLVGGRDLLAGGTWLAVSPADRVAACVLNGRGLPAPAASRRSRGVLPLLAASGRGVGRHLLAGLDPFHLLTVWPGRAVLQSWDGRAHRERELPPGLHVVVNSGLATGPHGSDPGGADEADDGRPHELARVAHFLPRFEAAARPEPTPGSRTADAWGRWLSLVDGDGLDPADPRALVVRRDLGDGRTWGTTSTSLVALAPGWVRYDFSGRPGDPDAWYSVSLRAATARR